MVDSDLLYWKHQAPSTDIFSTSWPTMEIARESGQQSFPFQTSGDESFTHQHNSHSPPQNTLRKGTLYKTWSTTLLPNPFHIYVTRLCKKNVYAMQRNAWNCPHPIIYKTKQNKKWCKMWHCYFSKCVKFNIIVLSEISNRTECVSWPFSQRPVSGRFLFHEGEITAWQLHVSRIQIFHQGWEIKPHIYCSHQLKTLQRTNTNDTRTSRYTPVACNSK